MIANKILIELQAGGYDVLPWPPASQLEDCDGPWLWQGGVKDGVEYYPEDRDIGWFDNQQGGIDCEGEFPVGIEAPISFDNDDCGGM
jgi:hypothetical protein